MDRRMKEVVIHRLMDEIADEMGVEVDVVVGIIERWVEGMEWKFGRLQARNFVISRN